MGTAARRVALVVFVFLVVSVARVDAFTGTTDEIQIQNGIIGFDTIPIPVVKGGTNQTTSPDDNLLVGNGTTWELKTVPNCIAANSFLQYTAATNTFSCGTVATSSTLGFSTNGEIVGAVTTFMGPSVTESTETRGQTITDVAATFDNLECISTALPGAAQTYTITMRDGACTAALTASVGQTCVISNVGRRCQDGTPEGAAESVLANECFTWSILPTAGAATAVVSCTVVRTS